MKSGYIPKNITFYCQKQQHKITVSHTNTVLEDIFSSFPVDTDKHTDTARKWALGYNSNSLDQPISYQYENSPVKNVRITGVDSRHNTFVYKAVVYDKFYIDLAPDEVLDIMQNSNITNGIIGCDMIFAKVRSTVKLIRVGGPIYNDFVEKETTEPIKLKDLKPGNYYKSARGWITYISDLPFCGMSTESKYYNNRGYNFEKIKATTNSNGFITSLTEETLKQYATNEFLIREDKEYVSLIQNYYFYFNTTTLPDKTSKTKIWHVKEIDFKIFQDILDNLESLYITEDQIKRCDKYLELVYNLTNILGTQDKVTNPNFKIAIDFVNELLKKDS